MLTRDLLLYRARQGKVMPRFLDAHDAAWTDLAQRLWDVAQDHVGETRATLTASLQACITHAPDAAVAKGMAKLVLDRLTFAEPCEGAAERRADVFARSTAALRALPADATQEAYEAALQQQFGGDALATLREDLYADLPESRPLLSLRPWSAEVTVQRYNLAQVQGLVLYSHALTVRTTSNDVLRIRRVLRWLKFCRLVAEVHHADDVWTLTLSGPAAIFAQQKKYGLQLAMFLPAVPLLDTYEMEATVELRRGKPWQLRLDHRAPLVSPYANRLGYLPPELAAWSAAFNDEAWSVVTDTLPRHAGTRDMCMPDFTFQHTSGAAVHVELFHRWHRHALLRRIEGLRSRPDAALLLGVDRTLGRDPAVSAAMDSTNNVFLFSDMPTQRKMKDILAQRVAASAQQMC